MSQRRNKSLTASSRENNTSPRRSPRETTVRCQQILTVCLSAFLTASIFCAPEGAIREGDYLPIALLFLMICVCASLVIYSSFSAFHITTKKEETSSLETSPRPRFKRLAPLWADISLSLCLLLYTTSCFRVVLLHAGDVRLALNGYWCFATPILFYFLLRYCRKLLTERAALELFLAVGACCAAECLFSLYSYAVVNPETRKAYLANPEKMLAENGMKFEKDSRERLLFEQRLLNSVEPTGSYGLANTLAGVVAPIALLSIVGIPWSGLLFREKRLGRTKRVLRWISLLGVSLFLLLELFVLFTTKSRSACLAFVFGLALWGGSKLVTLKFWGDRGVKHNVWFLLGALLLFLFAGVIAVFSGAIDREVFTEAGKSLSYRFEYWNATSRMIGDYPLWGVGPGEFQSVYPRYILPTSSEFIADPHNFALEIGALFGIPALLAFGSFLLATLLSALPAIVPSSAQTTPTVQSEPTSSSANDQDKSKKLRSASLVGLTLGLIATFFCSCFQSVPVVFPFYGFAIIAFCFFYAAIGASPFNNLLKEWRAPTFAFVVALVALLTNLCAAGGVGYAPISTLLFLIAATLVNRASMSWEDIPAVSSEIRENNRVVDASSQKQRKPIGGVLFSLVLLSFFYFTSYKPRTAVFLFELGYNANSNVVAQSGSDVLLQKLDSASSVVATQRYYWAGLEYFESQNDINRENWRSAKERIERVSPNSPAIRERCGDFDFVLYKKNVNRSEFLDSAITFYQESVERSPTDVGKKEKLFTTLRLANRLDEAREVACDALQFDSITPHMDRKLTDAMRNEMLGLVNSTR